MLETKVKLYYGPPTTNQQQLTLSVGFSDGCGEGCFDGTRVGMLEGWKHKMCYKHTRHMNKYTIGAA